MGGGGGGGGGGGEGVWGRGGTRVSDFLIFLQRLLTLEKRGEGEGARVSYFFAMNPNLKKTFFGVGREVGGG